MPVEWEAVSRIVNKGAATMSAAVASVISDVVSRVRASIAAGTARGKQPALGLEGTIPPEALRTALAMIRLDIAALIPGAINLTDENRKAILKGAESDLKALASGDMTVSPPAEGAASPPPTAPPLFGGEDRIGWPGDQQTTNYNS